MFRDLDLHFQELQVFARKIAESTVVLNALFLRLRLRWLDGGFCR